MQVMFDHHRTKFIKTLTFKLDVTLILVAIMFAGASPQPKADSRVEKSFSLFLPHTNCSWPIRLVYASVSEQKHPHWSSRNLCIYMIC